VIGHGATKTPTKPSESPQTGAGAMRNTILIVEDDPILQLFYSEQLETLGWKTLLAVSTASAMQVLADHAETISAMITDIEMPGTRNGITLANQVRFGWPEIGVVVVSGAARPRENDMPKGVAFYQKPLPSETLLAAVEDAIHSASESLGVPA
jgi:two-component system, response regulator PdtaR